MQYPFYRFMLITQRGTLSINEYCEFIKKCADGGITSLQIREKELSFDELVSFGEALLKILEPFHIPLIVNDSVSLASVLGTSYIHLGQSDDPVTKAFAKLGKDAHIGISIEEESELKEANTIKNLSYVTASAVYPSSNKSNIKKIWGIDGVKHLVENSIHPLTVIGGLTLDNIEPLLEYGAQGIALIGAIHNSENPQKIAQRFRNILDQIG